jgi:putative hydroxymethylpyrimidine transport system ATP-binding protein
MSSEPTPKVAPGINIRNAVLSYHQELLFDHLNLNLLAGEWTVILGPSGVGKSSLLRLIAGLTSEVSCEKISSTDEKSLQGRISYLPQQESLLPWLNVIENVVFGLKLRNLSSLQQYSRAKELLQQMGLQKVMKNYPHSLSGGMKQRVALARILLEDRPIVLMDEPFSALDSATRAELQTLAAEFLQNKTVLLVTHDPFEALRLGQNIYVMKGRPAKLGEVLHPQGIPPRPINDPELFKLQAKLLQEIMAAKELMA